MVSWTIRQGKIQQGKIRQGKTQQGKTQQGKIQQCGGLLLGVVLGWLGQTAPGGAQNSLTRSINPLPQWRENLGEMAQPASPLAQSPGDPAEQGQALGLHLEHQGQLQFDQGQPEAALQSWQQAVVVFEALGDRAGVDRSRINAAQALQELGFLRRSRQLLEQTVDHLQDQPNSRIKVVAWRCLGDVLLGMGEVHQAEDPLQKSLVLAQQLADPEGVAAAQLSLGNLAWATGDPDRAVQWYEQAAVGAVPPVQLQARLNQLNLLVQARRWEEAQAIEPQIWSLLRQFPLKRPGIYGWISLAQQVVQMHQAGIPTTGSEADIIQTLVQSHAQVRQGGDRRTESYLLGYLGGRYEQSQQWSIAQNLTQQALDLAQQEQIPELAYRWHWQLGRLLKKQENGPGAIEAYTSAVNDLGALRGDLVATGSETRFSFQAEIEPVYRELVELLLLHQPQGPSPEQLEKALQTIEALKLAELDNFFRAACLELNEENIADLDPQAAVFYPIVLPEQLVVLVRFPGQSPQIYLPPSVNQAQVEGVVDRLGLSLSQPNTRRYLPEAQKLYDWLIRPFAAELADRGIKTLVFVPDGNLRNIPMSVLHDGRQYLIEQYGVALVPGLQLVNQPLQVKQLGVLMVGLSEAHGEYVALPFVDEEFQRIQSLLPNNQILLNDAFTREALQVALATKPLPVVHVATHGQFSSELENTFLLAWDDRIQINDLHNLLQVAELSRPNPIELLVLSACETAAGDDRATLGLAGVATRAGARSTLATLWRISDETTARFMEAFYQALLEPGMTKAEANRRAQLAILGGSDEEEHPYYWAAYVLVGSWL